MDQTLSMFEEKNEGRRSAGGGTPGPVGAECRGGAITRSEAFAVSRAQFRHGVQIKPVIASEPSSPLHG